MASVIRCNACQTVLTNPSNRCAGRGTRLSGVGVTSCRQQRPRRVSVKIEKAVKLPGEGSRDLPAIQGRPESAVKL